MNYLIKHAWKIIGVLAVLLAFSLTGCTEEGGITVSGTGNDVRIIDNDAGDDANNVRIEGDAIGESCPAGTPITPECSTESQAACSCQLP